MEISPVHRHLHLLESFNALTLPILTVAEPGDQGVTVFGTQGIGVNTPDAAEVAAETAGLVVVVHMPKVEIFTTGL